MVPSTLLKKKNTCLPLSGRVLPGLFFFFFNIIPLFSLLPFRIFTREMVREALEVS